MTQPLDSDDLLTGDQKKRLRGLGHHLEPVVYIGREGLSPALVKSAEAALTARELIKSNQSQGGQSQAADLIHSRSGCCSLNEAFIAFTST